MSNVEDQKLAYRFISGTDDSQFCQRVSSLLEDGYDLYGAPQMVTRADGSTYVGQALILSGRSRSQANKAGF